MVESHEAVVGDGHAMGVAGEIAEHMMGTAEGWLGVADPVLKPGPGKPAQLTVESWALFVHL
jgi:hypothetical protein